MRPTPPLALVVCTLLLAGCTWPWAMPSQPGSDARALVSPRAHAKLVVELDHPPGHGPNGEALRVLESTLEEVTGRGTADVTIVQDASIPADTGRRYSTAELASLEAQHRTRKTGGDTAVLYVLYVAGGSTDDTSEGKVLGVAYGGTSLALFKGNIRASTSSGGILDTKPPEAVVERAVLVHEFGHAAGLVNLGTPMQTPHEDPEHPKHSSNAQSVMYWAVESSNGLAALCNLVGQDCDQVPYQFDAADKADLRALRES